MPTYEYECTSCGHLFEVFQNINDKHLEACPKCHKKVKRLIGSGSGIIFKGSGFYATDDRKTPKSKKEKGACPHANPGCGTCPSAN
jgi:putative FmdB family regulatory protein